MNGARMTAPAPMPEPRGWFVPALGIVLGITALRMAALTFDRTDLFVDEAQYWLWGQNLDFGYYSKPPLIAWVIRAFTSVLGTSDFSVRLPAMLFHAATALILGSLAARGTGARAGLWVAASYVTLPFVSLGSLLISTDTIMAPFLALALLFWFRAAEGRAGFGLAAGVALGLAALAKYAALYFLPGALLAALVSPALRPRLPAWALLLAGFGVVIGPNLAWNLSHDLTTLEHTADNVGWLRGTGGPGLHPDRMAGFLLAQFAVFGPVLFAVLAVLAFRRNPPPQRALLAFALPPLVVVAVQALLERAYANWAVSAYFAAVVLVVPWLLVRAPRLLWLSTALNLTVAVVLPALTVLAPWPSRDGQPLLARYLGQAALSRQVIGAARAAGAHTVLAAERDVLADLFYTGRDSGLAFRATRPAGRPLHYYQQMFPVSASDGPVLAVLATPPVCAGVGQQPVARFDTATGAHRKSRFAAYLIGGDCAVILR